MKTVENIVKEICANADCVTEIVQTIVSQHTLVEICEVESTDEATRLSKRCFVVIKRKLSNATLAAETVRLVEHDADADHYVTQSLADAKIRYRKMLRSVF